MEELLRAALPPDEELVGIIEQAFLEGQIDEVTADLAYQWLLRPVLLGQVRRPHND